MACKKCGYFNCRCPTWCAGGTQCCGGIMPPTNKYPAGPYVLTGEKYIGERKCAENMKKCSKAGFTWCSHTGKCDEIFVPGCPRPPFNEFNAFLQKKPVREGYNNSSPYAEWMGTM